MSKKEMIKNGENVSLDDGNVVVLNNVSVAEKETEISLKPENQPQELSKEEVAPAEVQEVQQEPDFAVPQSDSVEIPVPTTPLEQEIPQIPTDPIDLSGIISSSAESDSEDPTVYPNIDVNPVDVTPSFVNNDSYGEPQFSTPEFGASIPGDSVSNEKNFVNDVNSGVFKTEQDVDASFEKFMEDVKKSYDEHIATPTKTLVEFVNRFISWGNQVTANGLNRKLFDEYDELIALLQQKKSYNDQSTISNFEYNNNSNNTYGDDQFGNGMFR